MKLDFDGKRDDSLYICDYVIWLSICIAPWITGVTLWYAWDWLDMNRKVLLPNDRVYKFGVKENDILFFAATIDYVICYDDKG